MPEVTPGFQTKLVVEYLDGARWLLHEDFVYISSKVCPGKVFTTPKGFYTDFASVPRFLHSAVSPYGRHGKSAVVHDMLYFMGFEGHRATCDALFDEAMGFEKENSLLRPILYFHVRAYGRIAWDKHRRAGHTAATLTTISRMHIAYRRSIASQQAPIILTF